MAKIKIAVAGCLGRMGQEISKQIFQNKVIHQYAPIDHRPWVIKFVKHWSPNLVIWIESDLWPNTIRILSEYKIRSILEGRKGKYDISLKSFSHSKDLLNFLVDNDSNREYIYHFFHKLLYRRQINQKIK